MNCLISMRLFPSGHFLARSLFMLWAVLLPGLAVGASHDLGPAHNAAGATSGQTMQGGLPVGAWNCIYVSDNVNSVFTISSGLTITPDGVARFQSSYDAAFKPHYSFMAGKFKGLRRISWTTTSTFRKVTRIKDEIYCYPDAGSHAKLISGNPPGYSLDDYWSLGGTLSLAQVKQLRDDNGIDIYRIVGKDLVLENSSDGHRWLYKAAGMR